MEIQNIKMYESCVSGDTVEIEVVTEEIEVVIFYVQTQKGEIDQDCWITHEMSHDCVDPDDFPDVDFECLYSLASWFYKQQTTGA